MARNTESIVVTIAFARRSGNPDRVANAAAVAMLNHAAQAVLDAMNMLGGIGECPQVVTDAYSALTVALQELP